MKYLRMLLLGMIGMGISLPGSAQDKFYFNQWWEECEPKYQVYYMEWEKREAIHELRTYHSNTGNPIRKAFFRDSNWDPYWFSNEKPEDSTGWWSFYHPNGQLAAEWDIDAPVKILNLDEYKKMVGYPPMAKEAEIEGSVFYRFRISKTGEVLEKVIRTFILIWQ